MEDKGENTKYNNLNLTINKEQSPFQYFIYLQCILFVHYYNDFH